MRTTITALALAAAAPFLLVGPSSASSKAASCRTTLPGGGVVGSEVIASSHDVVGQVAGEPKVVVDQVVLNYVGQLRYRLAKDIALQDPRSPRTFQGGAGSYVSGPGPSGQLDVSAACVAGVLGGVVDHSA